MKNIRLEDIDKLVDVDSFFLKRRDNNFLLSDYQIDVLDNCGIKYNQYSDVKSLLYAILDYLDENDDEELELVSKQIDEVIYYSEFRK